MNEDVCLLRTQSSEIKDSENQWKQKVDQKSSQLLESISLGENLRRMEIQKKHEIQLVQNALQKTLEEMKLISKSIEEKANSVEASRHDVDDLSNDVQSIKKLRFQEEAVRQDLCRNQRKLLHKVKESEKLQKKKHYGLEITDKKLQDVQSSQIKMNQMLIDATSEIVHTNDQLASAKTRNKELLDNVNTKRSQISVCKRLSEELKLKQENLVEELEDQKRNHRRLEEEAKQKEMKRLDYEARSTELSVENESLQEVLAKLQDEVKALMIELENKEELQNHAQSCLGFEKKRFYSLDKKLEDLKGKNFHLSQMKDSFMATLEEENSNLQLIETSLISELSGVKQFEQDCHQKLEASKDSLSTRDAQLRSLKEELNMEKALVASIQASQSQILRICEDLSENNKNINESLSSCQSRETCLMQESNSLQKEEDVLNGKIEAGTSVHKKYLHDMNTKIEQLGEENNLLRDENKLQQKKLSEIRLRRKREIEEKEAGLRAEIQIAIKELSFERKQTNLIHQRNMKIEKEIQSLEKQLETKQECLVDLNAEIRRSRSTLNVLQADQDEETDVNDNIHTSEEANNHRNSNVLEERRMSQKRDFIANINTKYVQTEDSFISMHNKMTTLDSIANDMFKGQAKEIYHEIEALQMGFMNDLFNRVSLAAENQHSKNFSSPTSISEDVSIALLSENTILDSLSESSLDSEFNLPKRREMQPFIASESSDNQILEESLIPALMTKIDHPSITFSNKKSKDEGIFSEPVNSREPLDDDMVRESSLDENLRLYYNKVKEQEKSIEEEVERHIFRQPSYDLLMFATPASRGSSESVSTFWEPERRTEKLVKELERLEKRHSHSLESQEVFCKERPNSRPIYSPGKSATYNLDETSNSEKESIHQNFKATRKVQVKESTLPKENIFIHESAETEMKEQETSRQDFIFRETMPNRRKRTRKFQKTNAFKIRSLTRYFRTNVGSLFFKDKKPSPKRISVIPQRSSLTRQVVMAKERYNGKNRSLFSNANQDNEEFVSVRRLKPSSNHQHLFK